ncbi:protein ELC isoform X3 [Trematomus bernacchii]|uniref:protein ELC isoform X3 n=1 Tax=Trematomus bernacchii TaxID=40690 RepID=UPI00146CBD34|nr:protein ELC isoform X3 [Trematomus bernacchii]
MRVGSGEELRTLKECGYSYPEATLSDLREARALFSDLRLYSDFYCFPNKEKKKLVFLAGTLPVQYEGSGYNFPVCIWLHETHPLSPPRCLVCPSVSMVINPMCCCVDEVSGNIRLPVLSSWTQGVSSLSLLMSEMRQAFQKDTPLYARCPVQAPPPAADVNRPRPISPQRTRLFITPPHLSAQKGSQWEQSRKSYAEELQGIDFSCPAPSDPLSRGLEALSLDPQQVDSPVRTGQSGANIHTSGSVDLLPAAADHIQIISMTHCSCFLCESCFKAFFSSAIKEKSIDQLTCPQCGRPEVRGQGGGDGVLQPAGHSDPSLPPSSDPRAVPEEAERSSSAGDAQLHLVFTLFVRHSS